ncbi:MAG: hypothetical protein ACRDR6_30405, partial [Pseudonocardiaceae bacterium]
LGGGGALWTTAAAAPDAPPARPDAGDPALLACPVSLVFTPPDHAGRVSAVPRPVRCRWSGRVALHPTAGTRDHPGGANAPDPH